MLTEGKGVGDEVIPMDQLVGLLTDTDRASDTVTLHFICDEHVLPKDVVSDDLGPDNTTHYFARMDTNPHV